MVNTWRSLSRSVPAHIKGNGESYRVQWPQSLPKVTFNGQGFRTLTAPAIASVSLCGDGNCVYHVGYQGPAVPGLADRSEREMPTLYAGNLRCARTGTGADAGGSRGIAGRRQLSVAQITERNSHGRGSHDGNNTLAVSKAQRVWSPPVRDQHDPQARLLTPATSGPEIGQHPLPCS